MKIAIIGGGNIGTQLAVHCSQKNETWIYTSVSDMFVPDICIVDEHDNIILTGKNIRVTSDAKTAFIDCDYIFITYPAFMLDTIARILLPFAHKKMCIGIIPGTGGGECAFMEHIAKGTTVFGMQRVPSVARLIEKGKKVRAVGYRDKLYVASIPVARALSIASDISDFLGIACDAMPNYLNLTLTPSNPILHTTRLKILFGDYHEGVFYDRVPLFYEEWNNESSALLFRCDDEVQDICAALKKFDLRYVKSLKEHYGSYTPEALTAKIRSIKGFKGLTSPVIRTRQGYIPDFNSRYFTADFAYGLNVLVQIGAFLGLEIPYMESTLKWYQRVSGDKHGFSFGTYGIKNREDFVDFYSG